MKKLLSVFIISLLVWNTCILPVAAATPSIVIDGGAVAGGGVAGGTNAKGDLVSTLLGLVLASQGLQVKSDNPIDFLRDYLINYANYLGKSFESICDLWLSNVKVLVDGTIQLGIDNTKAIHDFLSFLKYGDNISNSSDFTEYVIVNGVKCPIVHYGEIINIYQEGSNLKSFRNESQESSFVIFWSDDQNTNTVYMFNKVGNFYWSTFINGDVIGGINGRYGYDINGLKYTNLNFGGPIEMLLPYVPDGLNSLRALNGNYETGSDDDVDNVIIGNADNIDLSHYNPQQNYTTIINPGINLSDIAQVSGLSGIVHVNDYLEMLQNAINGLSDNVIRLYDDNNVSHHIPVDYDVASTSTDDVLTSDLGTGTDLFDDNQLPSADDTVKYINHMQFDLINVFPFCIPFDIVNLLSKLDVEPVTPNVHLSFPNPVLSDPIEFDLNFSQWNGVAQVVRNSELVAFVVGLAMVTRSLIRG